MKPKPKGRNLSTASQRILNECRRQLRNLRRTNKYVERYLGKLEANIFVKFPTKDEAKEFSQKKLKPLKDISAALMRIEPTPKELL